MYERLADLDELVLRCRTDAARDYVREAVASYRAGAYRAAIVTTWVALSYDLIDKVRELGLTGSKEAERFTRGFEDIQEAYKRSDPGALKRSLEFERNLLQTVHDQFELITPSERVDLERLRDDRHRCAHPTMNLPDEPYHPTAELARLHLRNAIQHVLSRPPVQGKAALTRITKEISSEYFPNDVTEARRILEEGPLARPREVLIAQTIGYCFSELFPGDADPEERMINSAIVAIQTLLDLHPSDTRKVFGKIIKGKTRGIDDEQLHTLIILVARIDETWGALSAGTKSKIKTLVKTDPTVVIALSDLEKIDDLRPLIHRRIEKMDEKELGEVINHNGAHLCAERAVELFTEVGSWYHANSVADKVILPIIDRFSWAQIEDIITAPRKKNADLPGSGGFSQFLREIWKRDDLDKQKIEKLMNKENFSTYLESLKKEKHN